jgi:hypothetical protein
VKFLDELLLTPHIEIVEVRVARPLTWNFGWARGPAFDLEFRVPQSSV